MSKILNDELRKALPKLREQAGIEDPIVHATFLFSASGWIWFVTEGEEVDGDFLFYGHVIGFEREWGHFSLSELEAVNVHGRRVERDFTFYPTPFSECCL